MFKKLSNIGDSGIICDFGEEVNRNINTDVIKLFQFIKLKVNNREIEGITNCTPSYNKLIINFDLNITTYQNIYNFYCLYSLYQINVYIYLKNLLYNQGQYIPMYQIMRF